MVDDRSVDGIFNALKKSFTDKNIPMSNIIGYTSDTMSCNANLSKIDQAVQDL